MVVNTVTILRKLRAVTDSHVVVVREGKFDVYGGDKAKIKYRCKAYLDKDGPYTYSWSPEFSTLRELDAELRDSVKGYV